jgi:hypothetical protein
MRKKYKLIDRNLIRSFGSIEITLDETVGERFIREGKARNAGGSSSSGKSMHFPPSNKMVFRPPEEKSFEDLGQDEVVRYPGPEDKLFPHISK